MSFLWNKSYSWVVDFAHSFSLPVLKSFNSWHFMVNLLWGMTLDTRVKSSDLIFLCVCLIALKLRDFFVKLQCKQYFTYLYISRIFLDLPDFILVQAIFISLIASKSSFIDDLAKFVFTLDEICTLLKDNEVLKQLVFHPWQTSVMWFSGPLNFSFRAKFRSNTNESCQK